MLGRPIRIGWEQFWIGLAVISVLTTAFLAVLDYSGYGADWMGFRESTTDTKETTTFDPSRTEVTSIAVAEDTRRAKTYWDWVQIGIFPIAVAIATFVLNRTAKTREEAIENQRSQDTALQTYLEQMGQLLLEKTSTTSLQVNNVQVVARARTLTILEVLDPNRKRSVVQFLNEAQLITRPARPWWYPTQAHKPPPARDKFDGVLLDKVDSPPGPIVDLTGANFDGIDLSNMSLIYVYMLDVSMKGANLSNANLEGAALGGVDLSGANLREARISGALLADIYSILMYSKLVSADLSGAVLARCWLSGVDMRDADLRGVDFWEARMAHADLRGAKLDGADLRDVDLERVKGLTSKQIKYTIGNQQTKLPSQVTRPQYWNKSYEEQRIEVWEKSYSARKIFQRSLKGR